MGDITHYDGCWQDPKHHACALREIERQEQNIERLKWESSSDHNRWATERLNLLAEIERLTITQLELGKTIEKQANEIERLREKSEKDDRLIYAETEKVWLAKKEIERLRAELAAANRCGYGFIR